MRAAADDHNPRRRRHLRQHQVHQHEMPEVVDGESGFDAVGAIGPARHDLRRRVAHDRAQRGPPRSRVVSREAPHRLERGEVERHRFDIFVRSLREQPLDGLAALLGAAAGEDHVPIVGLGERSRALEAQAGVSTRHDRGIHICRDDCIPAKLRGAHGQPHIHRSHTQTACVHPREVGNSAFDEH